jgi:adenosylcobalamin-dependent ribonucleoside-triphosphate reductase
MSNNSIVSPENTDDLPNEFWETYNQGEPYGLINLELSRTVGRTGETQYPDPEVEGFNPCAEQSLANFETCCLAEVYLPNIESFEELKEVLSYAYRMNKHSLALHCSLKETETIVNKNMRMGIGMTGILQATEEQRSWLKEAYVWLREYDNQYSEKKGFPKSIKLTTVKPSGTLSLLAGVTPGVHPNPAGPYYIRRVRISSQSPLIDVCKKHGFPLEYQRNFDGSEDKSTMVVSFPCKLPETTPVAADFDWKTQMDMIRKMQAEWSDNSVSCTVYYRKEDIEDIKAYLKEHFRHEMKTVSFLLYYGHGFDQAPYETITKEQYEEMVAKTTPITSIEVKEDEMTVEECATGACPIK